MNPSLEQLRRIRFFADLSPSDLQNLQSHTRLHTYQKGEIVMHEGDRLPPCLHILEQGQLHIKKISPKGKESWVRTISSGEIFAAPAVFGDRMAPATAIVAIKSQLLLIPKATLLATIRSQPDIAWQLLEEFNQRLQQLHNTVHGLISEPAIVRLARLLLCEACLYGTQTTQTGDQLQIQLSYYQMARRIGITYEECARLVKSISHIITYQRGGKIHIKDWQALQGLAEDENATIDGSE
ncbi:Crp/Fnr family transcriptional regulator [Geitlerinema sp. PCC 9228]|uniref:Crp/Fnr family transcriptional regulator n=1 Tax=Geitlerinema sp. PCC 9228 TaxID=111611 RepID=UPI0008F9CDDA|nr:Crp/Fnr family transcriptional regulator [Geitlerinema sp. PCC 9228]